MTDDEREALVERMAEAFGPPMEAALHHALHSEAGEADFTAAMRAALSVAEPVVRADERGVCEVLQDKATRDALDWCLNWLNAFMPPEKVITNAEVAIRKRRDALQRDIDEHRDAIRARSTVAGEATP